MRYVVAAGGNIRRYVVWSTTPVAASPWRRCQAATAAAVLAPYTPSRCWPTLIWTAMTSVPVEP